MCEPPLGPNWPKLASLTQKIYTLQDFSVLLCAFLAVKNRVNAFKDQKFNDTSTILKYGRVDDLALNQSRCDHIFQQTKLK